MGKCKDYVNAGRKWAGRGNGRLRPVEKKVDKWKNSWEEKKRKLWKSLWKMWITLSSDNYAEKLR